MHYDLKLERVEAARQRIAPYVRSTPLCPMPRAQKNLPPHLHLKLENLQLTGSFKVRGVFNTLTQIDPSEGRRGVITASGGNHGVALAYGAQRLGLHATIYLPESASEDRVMRITTWGADVIRYGTAWDDANAQAYEHAAAHDLVYVHPFDADGTVEGQATLGLELLDDLPYLDCGLIAIGGGGLISGMAAAIKQRKPDVRIIGVEPTGATSMIESVAAGHVVALPQVRTIADTLAPRAVSERTRQLTSRYVDDIVLVDDAAMIAAMRWLWVECNQLVEPAGAAVIAALLSKKVDLDAYMAPVALICGGNAAAEPIFSAYEAVANRLHGAQQP